jgi:uncharacterized protein YggE
MTTKALLIVFAVVFGMTAMSLFQSHANQGAGEAAATSKGTITAEGSATVTGKPDSARVYFEVITRAKTVAAAREENARVVGKVQSALQALKLPDFKSRTRESNLSIKYADRDETRIESYEIRQTFSVLIKEADPEKLGVTAARILDVGLENGVNSGGRVEFFKADDTEMKRAAMTKAVEEAVANARAYAAGANLKPLGVAEITEQNWGSPFGGLSNGLGFQGGSGRGVGGLPTFVAGDWAVSCQVRVVLKY